MKTINKKAFRIFEKLVSQLSEDGYVKIDNAGSSFMPVSIEKIGDCKLGQLISLAHYYEQNGDLMADPEMVFIYKPSLFAMPISFKQDNLSIFKESVILEDGEPSSYYKAVQADQAVFAGIWLNNIINQQGL